MGRGRRSGFLIGLAVGVSACGSSSPSSSISTDPDGLRTFSVIREIDGNPVSCGLPNEPSPVRGILAGDPEDPIEPLWLVRGGRRLSVVWPEGFTVEFDREVVLYNDKGRTVARAWEMTELAQVSRDSAAGTYEDPYIASCWLFGEVYVYKP